MPADDVASQTMNNTFGCPLFSHASGPWQVSTELLWTAPADVVTDNNICASPLRPFFGVVAGKCQGTVGPCLLTMSQATNDTLGCLLSSAVLQSCCR